MMREHATKSMPHTFACAAPYGTGGMGQHLAQLVEEARTQSRLAAYYAISAKPNDDLGHSIDMSRFAQIAQVTPLRFSNGWQSFLSSDWFNRSVAAQLNSFGRARCLGFRDRRYAVFNSCAGRANPGWNWFPPAHM